MAIRSHSRLTLYWLLTLEVRLPKGWRGMVPMTSGSSRQSFDVPGTSMQTYKEAKWKTVGSSDQAQRFEFMRKAAVDSAHLEHVLYFDDPALEDGWAHGWDLDGTTVPGLTRSGAHYVAAERGHHRALLFHGAAGDERLRLRDEGFGYNRSGGSVVKLREDGYHLACRERKEMLEIADTCNLTNTRRIL